MKPFIIVECQEFGIKKKKPKQTETKPPIAILEVAFLFSSVLWFCVRWITQS